MGGDGVIRDGAIRLRLDDGAAALARIRTPTWFMDYSNSDGSLSEMCGNGIRVFTRYLLDEGLANSTRGRRSRSAPARACVG